MNSPRVTVLMPFHNAERYIREAVDSVLAQTFRDFELLAIDDGSSDASRAILNGYTDSRIRILVNERNLGLSETLNRGIRESACELIARMDADDIAAPTRLEKQLAFMSHRPDLALLGGFATIIDEHGQLFDEIAVPTDVASVRSALMNGNCFVHTTVMFRRSAVLAAGGYRLIHAEDYDLWLRLAGNHAVANMPESLVRYRVHSGQFSLTKIKQQRRFASKARQSALRVWRERGWLPSSSTPGAGVWGGLAGRSGTIGRDYINYAWLYARMGDWGQAQKLAIGAILHSPLSPDCWDLAQHLACKGPRSRSTSRLLLGLAAGTYSIYGLARRCLRRVRSFGSQRLL